MRILKDITQTVFLPKFCDGEPQEPRLSLKKHRTMQGGADRVHNLCNLPKF